MQTALLVLVFVFAALDWIGTERGWVRPRYLTKPATILALIAWFTVANRWQAGDVWFGLALILSLLGDVNLMLPARYFLAGLGAFLLAHVLYIVGFNQHPLNPDPFALAIVALVAFSSLRVYALLRTGLNRTLEGRKMTLPVIIYCFAISLMLISAWLCLFRSHWPLEAALRVGGGALLFYVSDSILAYTRFVGKIPHGDLLVMASYHLGQIAIIAGAALS